MKNYEHENYLKRAIILNGNLGVTFDLLSPITSLVKAPLVLIHFALSNPSNFHVAMAIFVDSIGPEMKFISMLLEKLYLVTVYLTTFSVASGGHTSEVAAKNYLHFKPSLGTQTQKHISIFATISKVTLTQLSTI